MISFSNEMSREKDVAIVVVHGGSFIAGNHRMHKDFYQYIHNKTNITVYSIEYSLAPEAQFPTPINEIVQFINGIDYSKVILMGDSAGGLHVAHALLLQESPKFNRAIRSQYSIFELNKPIVGLVSICGFLNTNHFTLYGKNLDLQAEDFLSLYGTQLKNFSVIDFAQDIKVPLFISDTISTFSFSTHAEYFYHATMNNNTANEYSLWYNKNLGHNFQFDYKIPAARKFTLLLLSWLNSNFN